MPEVYKYKIVGPKTKDGRSNPRFQNQKKKDTVWCPLLWQVAPKKISLKHKGE